MIRTIVVVAVLAVAAIILAAVVLTTSHEVFAQTTDRGALRTACMLDAKKFCASVQPGGGRILQCLHAHDKDLAPACRDALAAAGR